MSAYDQIMDEFRRKDIATIYDAITELHLNGCPAGITGQAKKNHILDILRQIRKAVDEEMELQQAIP